MTSTKQELLEIYSPNKAFKLFKKVGTVKKAISVNGKVPSLGELNRNHGDKFTEAYIKLWLVNLNDALGLKRPLTESQMDETAMILAEDYKNLNIADINLIFKKMKTGEFGEYYESLNMAKVVSIFKNYFDERMLIAAEVSLENHLSGQHEGKRSDEKESNIKEIMKNIEHGYKLEKFKKENNVK